MLQLLGHNVGCALGLYFIRWKQTQRERTPLSAAPLCAVTAGAAPAPGCSQGTPAREHAAGAASCPCVRPDSSFAAFEERGLGGGCFNLLVLHSVGNLGVRGWGPRMRGGKGGRGDTCQRRVMFQFWDFGDLPHALRPAHASPGRLRELP